VRPSLKVLWDRLLRFQDAFDPSGEPPDPSGSPKQSWGRWAEYGKMILSERDDLKLVAGIRSKQRQALMDAGVTTMQGFAALRSAQLPGLIGHNGIDTFRKNHQQAQCQCQTLRTGEIAIRLKQNALDALAVLPRPDDGDVFFDLEGMPLPMPGGARQYLIGVCTRDGGYHSWWSHSEEHERTSWREFLAWLLERQRRFPELHVYHYAPYEASALKRVYSDPLMTDIRGDIARVLGMLVDLYKVVRNSLVVGLPGYGLKQIERLYRDSRGTSVSGAQDSVVVYHRWLNSAEGQDHHTSEHLLSIHDYNRDDCESTLELLSWFRDRWADAIADAVGAAAAWEPPAAPDEGKQPTDRDEDMRSAFKKLQRMCSE